MRLDVSVSVATHMSINYLQNLPRALIEPLVKCDVTEIIKKENKKLLGYQGRNAKNETRQLPSRLKGLSYVEVLGGGVNFVAMYILLLLCFGLFVVLCVCFDLWRYCLSAKTFFFRMVSVLCLVSYLKFTFADNFTIHVILYRFCSAHVCSFPMICLLWLCCE